MTTFSQEKEQFINRVIQFIQEAVKDKKEIVLLDEESETFQEDIFEMPGIDWTDKRGIFLESYNIIKAEADETQTYGVKLIGYGMGEAINGEEKTFELGHLNSDALCLLADLIQKKYS